MDEEPGFLPALKVCAIEGTRNPTTRSPNKAASASSAARRSTSSRPSVWSRTRSPKGHVSTSIQPDATQFGAPSVPRLVSRLRDDVDLGLDIEAPEHPSDREHEVVDQSRNRRSSVSVEVASTNFSRVPGMWHARSESELWSDSSSPDEAEAAGEEGPGSRPPIPGCRRNPPHSVPFGPVRRTQRVQMPPGYLSEHHRPTEPRRSKG